MPYSLFVILQFNVLHVNRVITEKRLGSRGPRVAGYLYDDATTVYSRVLEGDPNLILARRMLGEAYVQKAMHDDATAEFQRAIGGGSELMSRLGHAHASPASNPPLSAWPPWPNKNTVSW